MRIYLCHFIYFFRMLCFQPTSPIRSEIDIKLGGTQCNLIMVRLKPWVQLQSSKKKKMVLREEIPNPERLQSTESKAIMWTCTVSAPEMTIVLYNLSGLPLYHVSDLLNYDPIFHLMSLIQNFVLHTTAVTSPCFFLVKFLLSSSAIKMWISTKIVTF